MYLSLSPRTISQGKSPFQKRTLEAGQSLYEGHTLRNSSARGESSVPKSVGPLLQRKLWPREHRRQSPWLQVRALSSALCWTLSS